MEFERRRHNHHHIEIAPLVDVVFLLLLFFMLTSHLVQEPAVRIKLPESRTSEVKPETARIIWITKTEQIYFQDRPVALDLLVEALKKGSPGGGQEPLKIKSDREAPVGFLIKVIDAVRLAGISNFSILTERR
jgi:biopolymer transport protein ExbD